MAPLGFVTVEAQPRAVLQLLKGRGYSSTCIKGVWAQTNAGEHVRAVPWKGMGGTISYRINRRMKMARCGIGMKQKVCLKPGGR